MTTLLSAISGRFTKALILGALFPAVVFVVLFLVFVAPLLPPGFTLPGPTAFGTDWNVLSVTLATLVLAGILYNLGTPLIQLYEGYPWQKSWLGTWRTRVHRERMERLLVRSRVLYELTSDEATPHVGRLEDDWSDTDLTLMEEYPDRPDLVMPRRLGNVIRSFERYPSVQYGIDAIYLWPRLIAIVPERYGAALSDARTSLVFLLGLSYLTATLGAATVAAGLAYLPPDPVVRVILPAVAFFLGSVWLYRQSFRAAGEWGGLVKGAFDLYRWDLLRQLGHEQQPRSRAAEWSLWSSISQQMIYGDEQTSRDETSPQVDYADAALGVQAQPQGIGLELSRGVDHSSDPREMHVVVVIENTDPDGRTATDVVVTDRPPLNTAYRWNSAVAGGRAVRRVAGTGRYRFYLDDVPAGESLVLTYSVCFDQPARER